MKYEVFARKWRPRQFDDVVGQDHVTRTLKNAIETDRLAHAYLLVGPRGIGKTSIARIFAKALNCDGGPTVTPCDKCDSCREIAVGSSLDVQEIDGASNNSVDQIRDLRETVKYAPTKGNYKIYIIDEVHMLSTAAFNALLKTLEEPPPQVKFIFATTEPEKILPTILSRCQRFDLRRIPVQLIVERLEKICGEEGIEADHGALFAVARASEGGLRDAESALDQLVSFKGEKIAEEDVLSVFGLASRSIMQQLAGYIISGEVPDILRCIDELDKGGKDLQRLTLDLVEYFRDMLVCMHVGRDAETMDLMSEEIQSLREQAKNTDTEKILRFTDILVEAENRMRYALSKRTLLETALIRCSRAASVASLGQIMAMINEMKQGGSGKDAVVHESSVSYRTSSPAKQPENRPSAKNDKEARVEKQAESRRDTEADLKKLKTKWNDVIEHAAKMSVIVRSALKDARPLTVGEASVTIGFDPEGAKGIERFETTRNRNALERALHALLKRKVRVEFEVIDELPEEAEAEPEQETAESDSGQEKPKSEKPKSEKKTRKDLLEDPAVQKTLETFNGSVIDIKE